jgi:hypothetical protein
MLVSYSVEQHFSPGKHLHPNEYIDEGVKQNNVKTRLGFTGQEKMQIHKFRNARPHTGRNTYNQYYQANQQHVLFIIEKTGNQYIHDQVKIQGDKNQIAKLYCKGFRYSKRPVLE